MIVFVGNGYGEAIVEIQSTKSYKFIERSGLPIYRGYAGIKTTKR